MSSGREFQISEAATGKARLPTVVDVTGGIRMLMIVNFEIIVYNN